MSYTNVPSEILSEIIDLLLQMSSRFELKNGRYVFQKGEHVEGEHVENDISRLKELSKKVPEPLSSLLVSMANSSDNFFRLWSKTVDTLLELSKSNYIDR